MATKAEVQAAIAAERQEVTDALAAQDAKIAELEAKIAEGGQVTEADMEELRTAVQAIYAKPENPTPDTTNPA